MTDEEETQIVNVTPQLSIVESQERANIDMLIATAKKYPRDITRVKRSMEAMACLDEETAESCNYHLERNGKSIDGPSVRMAEIAVACYQNIRSGSRVISNDGKTIVGQAFCHDLENNVFIAWETPRRITDKNGKPYSEDMIVTTGNAASAIAFRNAVFKVIPGALIRPAAEKARQVAFGDLKTLSYRRTRALASFQKIGVSQERILAFLQKKWVDNIDVGDVEKLYGIFTAIKEGSTTAEEQFPKVSTVVEPNFGGSTAPQADETVQQQEERQKRHRRTKLEMEAARAAQSPQDAPQPAPEAQPAASAATAPAPAIVAHGSLFTNEPKEQPALGPAAEVMLRLNTLGITHEKFLLFLESIGTIGADPADISMGHYVIGHVPPETLQLALKDWDKVVAELKENS